MPRFRKKPVVIEARQIPVGGQYHEYVDLEAWCGGAFIDGGRDDKGRGITPHIVIPTLEGDHRGDFGDWIIKGVKGEFYPCKPEIFEMTYEPVE